MASMAAKVSLWVVVTTILVLVVFGAGGDDDKQQAAADGSPDYAEALGKAILFFEGQRSGRLPANQRARWRGDSALNDGRQENVNLTGGYYDAGDNVKFVFPMAFTVTLLSWSADEYRGEVAAAGQLGNLRAAIRWGADFLLRAHTSPTTLYTQVGDGNADHQCWERPEDMDTPRSLYKITADSPGSEAAGEAAAALAAAYLVFKDDSDKTFSSRLLAAARSVFELANNYRGSFQSSCPFYCSYSGFQDELLWASAWLHRATQDATYLDFLVDNEGSSNPVNEFSWDNKLAGAQMLATQEYLRGKTELARYKDNMDAFVCALMPNSGNVQIQTTPGGLLFTRDSVNMQYTVTAGLLLSIYSKALRSSGSSGGVRCSAASFSPVQIITFATSQVGYTGINLQMFQGFARLHCSVSDNAPCFRWITSWGRTPWACPTWWGSAPSSRGASTTAARPSRRSRFSAGQFPAEKGSHHGCRRATQTRTSMLERSWEDQMGMTSSATTEGIPHTLSQQHTSMEPLWVPVLLQGGRSSW
ncbi:hypothetical protein BRADI_3g34787v3 [Brachypodium distachyon]|uniref:cellulase n=1 Tax=Brachypodium distachyon TaxID=15368 RepID=A0A0Q3M0P7_BRADI|nr:hypothetical protein BRADI_3g34787v3 [Brachypodium distachyon]